MNTPTKFVMSCVVALVWTACGGGNNNSGDVDGGTIDSGVPMACTPVLPQTGCQAGEKCARLTISDGTTTGGNVLAQTVCVPNGSVAEGQACTQGMPGQETGYDDCVAGYDCFEGICKTICAAEPDTCRGTPDPGFGNGDACGNSFVNHFDIDIGVCLPSCDPTNDIVVEGVAESVSCGAGFSCGMDPITAKTSCARTVTAALDRAQNSIPLGPSPGEYYTNGCAPGFNVFLRERNGADSGEAQCSRYCTPSDTYLDAGGNVVGAAEGANGKCGAAALEVLGGTNGHGVPHQCRFIQTAFTDTSGTPAEVGMCTPTTPVGGGATADCNLFEFDAMKEVLTGAAAQGLAEYTAAFNEFCVEDPGNPMSPLTAKCLGFFRGCVSTVKLAEIPPAPPLMGFAASEPGFNQRFLEPYQVKADRQMQLDFRE